MGSLDLAPNKHEQQRMHRHAFLRGHETHPTELMHVRPLAMAIKAGIYCPAGSDWTCD